ncbi:MAG: condensation domain-containing protein, partial [Chitinophagaceae bacterium]
GNPDTFISAGAMGANLLTHLLGQDMQDLGNKIKLYREARKKNGHDEKAGKVTVMLHAFIGEDINEVEKIVEQPFIEYLKSSVGVSKITLEQAGIRESDLTEEVKEKILKGAFRRYYKTSALIGTIGSCGSILKDLKEIGIDEVACLIDFGVEENIVLSNLKNLKKLKALFSKKVKKLHRPVTMMQSTPSYMKLLQEDKASGKFLQSLNAVLIGGEALPLSLVKTIREQCGSEIYNMYGPTETTIWSCIHRIERKPAKVLIGKPMMNTQVYILSEEMKLLPAGVAGDMYIGGKGVARGYLNNPGLTAERFVSNPFSQGERIYKTGDIARWLPDGTIEFIGRKDNQVKLRGYRIEPAEIENALQTYPAVESVAVTVRSNIHSEKELIAYLVSSQKLSVADLREWLGKTLPLFMIPDAFVQLESLPLTANGKIDRKRLPDPASLIMDTGIAYMAPRTTLEEKLVAVWQEVLGKEKVGIKDDYFELGGNSLKAMRVIKRIMDETSYSVPLTVLFTERTVDNLAVYIDKLNTDQANDNAQEYPENDDSMTDVSYSERVYFSEWYAKEAHVVVSAFEYMDIDVEAFKETIYKLIARHEILRTAFINVDGVLKQRILRVEELNFTIPDPVVVTAEELAVITEKAYHTKFDLTAAPLLQVNIYKKQTGSYVILIVAHHILSDGYSANVTANELPLLYAESVAKRTSSLPPLAFQYRDFANWQMNFVSSPEGAAHRDYWLNKLEGFKPAIQWPFAQETVDNTEQGVVVNMIKTIDGAFYDEVDRFARKNSLTYAGLLLGTLTLLLHRLSGEEDVTVFTQVSGRDSKYYGRLDVTGLLGNFTNMLLVRNPVSGKQSAVEFLKQVQHNFLQDLGYDAYPVDKLVHELSGIQQDHFLRSTVLFNYHNYSYLKEMNVETGESETETKTRGGLPLQQAFILGVSEYENCMALMFAFNKNEMDHAAQIEIRDQYFSILEQVIQDPQLPVSQIDFTHHKNISKKQKV